MKRFSFSLIIKMTGIIFIAFAIVLGNEMRLGIDRYVKNTLKTDAEATKLNLDKFSKSYVETLSMDKVDLNSEKFQNIYRYALGDSSKIKCLVDKQGKIIDISREGQITPCLGILLNNNQNYPVYFNLSSLDKKDIRRLETLLRENDDKVNQISITVSGKEMETIDAESIINYLDHIQIKELIINDQILIQEDIQGKSKTFEGVVNSYESYNLEIYFYTMTAREKLKSSHSVKTKALIMDYENMIKGVQTNVKNHFKTFIKNGHDLPPTNYADYFLLKPYEYNGKSYSTVVLRLIDWSPFNGEHSDGLEIDLTKEETLETMTAGYILVTQEYDNLTMNAFRQFMVDNSSTYFLAFILIGLISLMIGYSIIMPIRRIQTTAKHIAKKEFDYPIDMSRHDELGDLSRSIDKMSKELEKTINNLYQEVDRVQKLEQVRKEFVSNFTHEIKTPLGIINGFSELVELEQDEKKRNEYIQIIQSETKRINELVLAMLDLSHLESQNIALSLEDIDLLDIVDESIDSMMYLFEKKKIKLITNLDSAHIHADHFKMEIVIDNFISNALRYTEEGKSIKIELDEHHFSIENEGAHIPEDELDKVWLTFHKVDKARNEKGTGLGLAICKAALDSHHFKYGVKNTKTGVLFYFTY